MLEADICEGVVPIHMRRQLPWKILVKIEINEIGEDKSNPCEAA